MEAILQWGLDCIRLAQSFASPPLTLVMRAITALGTAPAYMVLLPFIYWCVNEKKGLRLMLMVLISMWVNVTLKFLLDQPRPFFEGYDPSLGMVSERMGGFPSGHAQNSLVLLVIIASWAKGKKGFGLAAAAAAIACLLISFSRVYLGVHFPTDIFGGWIIGAALLCGYFLLADKVETFLAKGGFRAGMISGAAASFLMILYVPGGDILMAAGVLLGMCAGYCLNRRYIGFSASNFSGKSGIAQFIAIIARFAAGAACLLLILAVSEKLNLRGLFPGNYKLVGFMRFAIAGLWVSVGAPWLFRVLHLAFPEKNN